MTTDRVRSRVAVAAAASVVVTMTGGLLAAPVAHAAMKRYASPDGKGQVCSHSKPCPIIEAVDQAPSGSEVVIEPGRYGTSGKPILTEITDGTTSDLDVHGIAGRPLPVITSAADIALQMASSRVSHLKVIAAGTTGGVSGTAGDHLWVKATNTSGPACSMTVSLAESVCIADGDATDAISYTTAASLPIALDNVTAVANGAHGIAVAVHETGVGLISLSLSSSVLAGAGDDLALIATGPGQIVLTASHSRYQTVAPAGLHNNVTVTDAGGNIDDTPKFRDPASDDYQAQAGSPTVDTGAADPNFSTDLADQPRRLGHGVDMGAYEHLLAPKVRKIAISKHTHHSIVVRVVVDSRGLSTKVRLTARHGKHRARSHVVHVGGGGATKTVQLAVHGLDRHTSYRLRATASSDGGSARHGAAATTR